ncbi:MAG: hypothetical protein AB7V58_05965 [Solirubrobacterales bacterium]
MEKQDKAARFSQRAELDRQPEDAISEAGVAVCRLTLVSYPEREGGRSTRTAVYVSGRLAERCRDGLNEGDVIEAVGLAPPRSRPRARITEVVVPDAFGAIKLRLRAPQIADAARGGVLVS